MVMEDINLIKSHLDKTTADYCFRVLLSDVHWTGERKINGKIIKIKRKMAYYSRKGKSYNYADMELEGNHWTPILMSISEIIEENFPEIQNLNSVLLNLYETGKDEIRWHSDKEPQLGENPIIPCLNLGASRNFWFMEKSTGIKTPYLVENGDLLIMGPNCQNNYLHAILKEKDVKEPRISLTFRRVYD